MFCVNCGATVAEGQRYCSGCGRQVPDGPPPAPAQGRIERHVKVLAILWLALSALRLIPGIGLLAFGSFGLSFVPVHMRLLLLPVTAALGVFLIATAVVGLVAGWGLLDHRPWARILAIILGIIVLIHVPLGTALGIYTLWVLLPAQSEEEYRRLAGAV